MRTALDADILSAIWSKEPSWQQVARAIGESKLMGALVLSGIVYAELMAHPASSNDFVEGFLKSTGIAVDFETGEAVWRESGIRYSRFVERRRRRGAGEAKRLLADFVVGSHALLRADRLMTLDYGRYSRYFPELRLVKIE